jgi:anti-sigma-K factor RskA
MNHEPFELQVAAHALGALDGADLASFEAHLAQGCSRCEAVLRDYREALAALARAEPPAPPPARIREELMGRLETARRPRALAERPGWPRLRWALAAAAGVVVASGATAAFVAQWYQARLDQVSLEAGATRDRLTREQAALRERLAAYEGLVELIREPGTRVVTLRGLGPSSEAVGRLVWHERAGGQLIVAKLPPAPAGKAYELWTIARGKPRPAGVFQVDAAGGAVHRVAPTDGPVDVFAVTLEPAGGVPTPTGPIVLASR